MAAVSDNDRKVLIVCKILAVTHCLYDEYLITVIAVLQETGPCRRDRAPSFLDARRD